MPEPCALCPLAGTGTPCPDPDYYCPRVARDARLPPVARFWGDAARRAAGVEPAERATPPLPPLAAQAASLAGAAVRFAASGFKMAGKDFRAERLATCKACPHWIAGQGRCSLCGCYTELKVGSAAESCPDDPPRWGAV